MPGDAASGLSALLRSATIHDHEEILRLSTAAVGADKGDLRSQRARVVALLKLDRFDDAVRAIADGGDKLEQLCRLELAYALYKMSKLEQAAAVLGRAGPEAPRAFQHLHAQVAYRAERFGDALEIYRRLLPESEDVARPGEESDILVNSLAAVAQLEWQGIHSVEGLAGGSNHGDQGGSFEAIYNRACASIGQGDHVGALGLLQQALRLCDESDDLTDEDRPAERLPLLTQQAYVLAKLGRESEALAVHRSIGQIPEADAETVALARTNLRVLDVANDNPFLTQRRMGERILDSIPEKTAFEYQKTLQQRNRDVGDLLASKFRGVEVRAKRVLRERPCPSTSAEVNNVSVAWASARCNSNCGRSAKREAAAMLADRPNDIGLLLATMQLYLDSGNIAAASSLLEAFFERQEAAPGSPAADVRYSPGLAGLAAALYRRQGRGAALRAELAASSAHWRTRGASAPGASALLCAAGVELMKSSRPDERAAAAAAFAAVHDRQNRDPVAAAGVVACFAATDPKKAEDGLGALPPVDTLIAGVDPKALLDGGVILDAQSRATVRKRTAEADGTERLVAKKRRRKLPKNYEEGKVMDPERWLPLRDRSSYRPKGRKGKKKAQESTQGGMVKDEETLELVGGAGAVRVEKAPTASSASKRKKKGKR